METERSAACAQKIQPNPSIRRPSTLIALLLMQRAFPAIKLGYQMSDFTKLPKTAEKIGRRRGSLKLTVADIEDASNLLSGHLMRQMQAQIRLS